MQWLPRYRVLCWLAAAAVVGLLGFGFFLQYVKNLEPCPLCILQRMAFLLVGLAFVVGALRNPANTGRKIQGSFSLLFSLAGISLASRQVWLQSLPPDQVPGCGFGLDYMMEVFPLWEVFLIMVQGTGDCAEIQWQFLGLTIAGWSLLAFSGFAVLSLWIILMGSKVFRD